MTAQLDISILETSFDLIAPRREELVDRFYRTLFSKAPTTRALFVQADMRAQKRALLGALIALRRSLRDLPSIAPFLAELGARHARYGCGPSITPWSATHCSRRWPRSAARPGSRCSAPRGRAPTRRWPRS